MRELAQKTSKIVSKIIIQKHILMTETRDVLIQQNGAKSKSHPDDQE